MPEGIDLFQAIDTQRGIRYFRPDPVPDDLITRLLQAAIKAPTGGVNQDWSFIVIRDRETRRRIGDMYRAGSRFVIGPDLTAQQRRVYRAAQHLEDHMEDVPVLILACIQVDPGSTTWGSSIYPAVQRPSFDRLRTSGCLGTKIRIRLPPLPLWERIEVRGITPNLTFPLRGGRNKSPDYFIFRDAGLKRHGELPPVRDDRCPLLHLFYLGSYPGPFTHPP